MNNPGVRTLMGLAFYAGQDNAVYDISQYSYVNFYVKAPAGSTAWGLTLRERSGTVPNTGNAPRAQISEADMGPWDSQPGFVAGEWSYISVPFSALTPNDGAAGSDPGFSGDFSRYTDMWMYTWTVEGPSESRVFKIDHITFSTTSEGGMLAPAPDQDVVEAVAGSIGGSVTLTIPNAGSATSATWTLDGDTQAGETGITLELTDLVAGDSGAYVASFNDGSAANTYTANLTVTAAPTGLPVAGLFGLVTLVVGLAAGGTAAMRRRK
jgi:hypothetical protein